MEYKTFLKNHLRHFLGYQKGPDNLPEIVEEEAAIVRLIYRMFLYEESPSAIVSHLTDADIQTAFLAAFNKVLGNRAEVMKPRLKRNARRTKIAIFLEKLESSTSW